MLELKLFKKEDLQKHYVFLQMPRAMIEKEIAEFKLSISEKFLYVLMLDRISLSAKNNWVNENGDVFIFYTLDEIAEQMDCSKTTAKKNLDGLVAKNFVVKESQGVGKANRIYLGNVCPLCEMYDKTDDEMIADNEHIIKEETVEKIDNNVHTVSDLQQAVQSKTQQITGIDTAVLEQVIATVTREVMGSMGFGGNDEVVENQSVTVAESKKYKEETQHKTVAKPKKSTNNEKAKEEVREEIAKEKGLPKIYMNDKKMMNLAIKEMIDFDKTVQINMMICRNKPSEIDKKYMNTLNLFCDALTEMLIHKGVMELGGMRVNATDVYIELQKYIDYSNFQNRYMIDDLCGAVQMNFNKAMDNTTIKNKMKYMQICIFNSLLTLADEMAVDMAEIDREIDRIKEFKSSDAEEVEEVVEEIEEEVQEEVVEKVEVKSIVENKSYDDEQKEAEINQFYEDFTVRWCKLTGIDELTDANKSQLNILHKKFPTDIILETLDRILEDNTILKNTEIYYFVWNFDDLKVA